MRETPIIKDDINKKLKEFEYLKSIKDSTINFNISNKLMNLITKGEVTEYYLPVCGSTTRKLTKNPKKVCIIGFGWINYTIHRDADDFRTYSDRGQNEEVHYMKRYLDNIREESKLRPFTSLTFNHKNKTGCTISTKVEFVSMVIEKATQYDQNKHKGYVIVLRFNKSTSFDVIAPV